MSCLINERKAKKKILFRFILFENCFTFSYLQKRRMSEGEKEEGRERAGGRGGEKPWNRWQWNETNLDFLLSRLFFYILFQCENECCLSLYE